MAQALQILPMKTAPMLAVVALLAAPLLLNHGLAGLDDALARVAAANHALRSF